jgi:hypothetical protein
VCRHLLNLATLLSLSLSILSAAMWVRSRSVSEAWELTPRTMMGPKRLHALAMRDAGITGWANRRLVGSVGGRLVWVEIDDALWVAQNTYQAQQVTGGSGYRKGTFIPHPQGVGTLRRMWAVSWVVPALAFAVPPAVRAGRRWRRSIRPAFSVLPPKP